MGILRTFLALCVLVEHSGRTIFGIQPLPGLLAVQGFYVISGFYMALVLTEKYDRPGGLRQFYRARARRLFPIYWTVLAATIVLGLILQAAGVPTRLDAWTSNTGSSALVTIVAFISNIVMFGLDWIRLTMTNTHENEGALILVVQAWTLGLELTFYLFAPALVRLKTGWLVLIAAASFALRTIVYAQGPIIHVWTNGFFPFELAFFVSGMLGYRAFAFVRGVARWDVSLRRWGVAGLIVILALGMLGFEGAPPVEYGWGPLRNWIFLLLIAVALPALFLRFGSNRLDDAIGQFSYPIYMFHFLIVSIVTAIAPKQFAGTVYIVLPLTVLGCIGLIRVFELPQRTSDLSRKPPPEGHTLQFDGTRPAGVAAADRKWDGDYSVLVTPLDGGFRLSIKELLLVVSGSSLEEAYRELQKRKQELIAWAGTLGSLDEVPPPRQPPALRTSERPPLALRAKAALSRFFGQAN